MQLEEKVPVKGVIEVKIESQSLIMNLCFNNKVLKAGKKSLVQAVSGQTPPLITHMIFGNGGYSQGQLSTVTEDRNELFGVAQANKKVIGQVDDTQSMYVAALEKDECNDSPINEIALQMSTGDLFSLATFPDLVKNNEMKITFKWKLIFE